MGGKDILLLFFIIYDVIITFLFMGIICDLKDKASKREKYLDEILIELEKARRKWYPYIKEDIWKLAKFYKGFFNMV